MSTKILQGNEIQELSSESLLSPRPAQSAGQPPERIWIEEGRLGYPSRNFYSVAIRGGVEYVRADTVAAREVTAFEIGVKIGDMQARLARTERLLAVENNSHTEDCKAE